MKDVAEYLAQRINELDWHSMLEQARFLVVTQYRQGEPTVNVGTLPEVEKPKYRLFPLLLDSEANMIFGPGGSGKSKLACFIALIVQSGVPILNLKPTKGNVLLLDYETSQYETDNNLKMLKRGMKFNGELQIAYRFCSQPLFLDIPHIQRRVTETSTDLVIVDSVGGACGGEPESAEVVLKYFMSLRSLRVTTLSIDHVAKKSDGAPSPFGSVYKYNSARQVFEVRKAQEAGESELTIGLYHRKCNTGKLLRPFGYKFSFGEDGNVLAISKTDMRDEPELSAGLSLRERMIGILLRSGGMTADELAEETGSPLGSVKAKLSKFKGNDFIMLGDGKWGVIKRDMPS
jgi:hypothetical protein